MYIITSKSKQGVAYSKLGSAISSLDPTSNRMIMLYSWKKRNIIIGVLVLLTFLTAWVVFNPEFNASSYARGIVSETHNHISNNINKIKNINVNINVVKIWHVDDKYLEQLGFNENSTLYPVDSELTKKMVLPLIVTAVASNGDYSDVVQVIKSMQKYLRQHKMLIYNLGMGESEVSKLNKLCNKTKACRVEKFEFDDYPSHIRKFETGAYKPLIMQLSLATHGAIMWTGLKEQFITSHIENVTKKAETVGLAAWSIEDSTSALTHPRMFPFFNTKIDNYYFQRMVKTDHLVIYNTHKIHNHLMLPWVECALTEECIWPTGAQGSGCNFQRRPRYKYSGCHRFEMSALNIILGIMFEEDFGTYVASDKIFGHEIIIETTTPANFTTVATATPPGDLTDQDKLFEIKRNSGKGSFKKNNSMLKDKSKHINPKLAVNKIKVKSLSDD